MGAACHGEDLFAIVLAAGGSSRLGHPKQLVEFGGRPLIARALAAARGVCGGRVIAVLGSEWRRVLAAAGEEVAFFAVNEDWRSGLASSLRLGLRALPGDCPAVLVLLCDQPLVSDEDLSSLFGAWRRSPSRIVASRYADTLGVPAIFPAAYFGELAGLRGDRGARGLIRRHRNDVLAVDCDDAALDIDGMADLERLRAREAGR